VRLDLTIVHADTPTLLANLEADNAAAQIGIYINITSKPEGRLIVGKNYPQIIEI